MKDEEVAAAAEEINEKKETGVKLATEERQTSKAGPEEKKTNEESKKNEIHTTDSSGNIIYSVTSNGFCFPVESLLDTHFKGSPTVRNRRTRFGEYDRNESKTKKLKSSRQSENKTQYRFDGSQITEKTFCSYPAKNESSATRTTPSSSSGFTHDVPPTFTFTAKNPDSRPYFSSCGHKQEERRDKNGNAGRRFGHVRVGSHGSAHAHSHNFQNCGGRRGWSFS